MVARLKSTEIADLARLNYFYSRVFGHDLDMADYDNRIRLQKLVYILKYAGVDFNYHFTWYLRGPYSPGLADDGYQLNNNIDHIPKNQLDYQPAPKEQVILGKIENARDMLNDADNAELIASYLYLKKGYGQDAQKELRTRKPRFELDRIDKTLQNWSQKTQIL